MQEIGRGEFFPLGSIDDGCKRCIENLSACLACAAVFCFGERLLTDDLNLEEMHLVAFGDTWINIEGSMSLYTLQIAQQHFAKGREEWMPWREQDRIQMLVPLLERFVERKLTILLCRHTIAPRSRKMLITQTDGKGSYRLDNVPPGRYYIVADVLAPTYYPGTSNLDTATIVTIRDGTTLTGLDFVAVTLRTAKVSGKVVNVARESNLSTESKVSTLKVRLISPVFRSRDAEVLGLSACEDGSIC